MCETSCLFGFSWGRSTNMQLRAGVQPIQLVLWKTPALVRHCLNTNQIRYLPQITCLLVIFMSSPRGIQLDSRVPATLHCHPISNTEEPDSESSRAAEPSIVVATVAGIIH